ncbi:MAG: hypothetical protein ACOCXM_07315 [Myxococcota bacterium]
MSRRQGVVSGSRGCASFILHQLDVLGVAIKELAQHLYERVARLQELERPVAHTGELNHRQRALLQHAVHHPMQSYTIDGHDNGTVSTTSPPAEIWPISPTAAS